MVLLTGGIGPGPTSSCAADALAVMASAVHQSVTALVSIMKGVGRRCMAGRFGRMAVEHMRITEPMSALEPLITSSRMSGHSVTVREDDRTTPSLIH